MNKFAFLLVLFSSSAALADDPQIVPPRELEICASHVTAGAPPNSSPHDLMSSKTIVLTFDDAFKEECERARKDYQAFVDSDRAKQNEAIEARHKLKGQSELDEIRNLEVQKKKLHEIEQERLKQKLKQQ